LSVYNRQIQREQGPGKVFIKSGKFSLAHGYQTVTSQPSSPTQSTCQVSSTSSFPFFGEAKKLRATELCCIVIMSFIQLLDE
jgi:hypothetical protein